MKDNELTIHDMDRMEDLTDWAALDAMTDEEMTAAALSDPDAQSLTEEELRGMRRLSELPGETVFEKLRALKAMRLKEIEQERTDMTVKVDPDIARHFDGRAYKVNNILRAWMEAQTETQHS